MNQAENKNTNTKEESQKQRRRKLNVLDRILTNKCFFLFLFIPGAAIFVYPLIADRYYTIVQDDIITEYFDEVEAMQKREREEIY